METLDKHFRKLAGEAFRKHGFATADLLTHWRDVVGEDLASLCAPERIRWPRGQAAAESMGATLVVRASPGRALDTSYRTTELMERINLFLGFQAIAKVKVHATASSQKERSSSSPALRRPDMEGRLEAIADPTLKEALSRLGSGVLTDKSRSPQGQ